MANNKNEVCHKCDKVIKNVIDIKNNVVKKDNF